LALQRKGEKNGWVLKHFMGVKRKKSEAFLTLLPSETGGNTSKKDTASDHPNSRTEVGGP